MDEQQLHEVALAYAQVKLQAYQEQQKDVIGYDPFSGDSDELRAFARAYAFALNNFESELESIG